MSSEPSKQVKPVEPKSPNKPKNKGKRRAKLCFDSPFSGPHIASFTPSSPELQAHFVDVFVSQMTSLLRDHKKNVCSNVVDDETKDTSPSLLIVGTNAVCRAVESHPDSISAVIVAAKPEETTQPTTEKGLKRVAFGVGSPLDVVVKHIALCCGENNVPVCVLDIWNSHDLGRALHIRSAIAVGIRNVKEIKELRDVVENVKSAQAVVHIPWKQDKIEGGVVPVVVMDMPVNPSRPEKRKQHPSDSHKPDNKKKQKLTPIPKQ